MSWYKQVITILLVNLSTLLLALAQSSASHFINPPPEDLGNVSTPNPTWYLGSVQQISWQTTSADFTIYLWQQTIGEEILPIPIYTPPQFVGANQTTSPIIGNHPWLVDIGTFSLADSNQFWFYFSPKFAGMNFQSHYFFIESGISPSTSSSSTSSLSGSTLSSSTTTRPILTGLQSSVSSTNSPPSTSVDSSTPASSSEPSSSTSDRRKKRLGLGIGLGLGGGVAVLTLMSLAILVLSKRRRRTRALNDESFHGPTGTFGTSQAEKAQDAGLGGELMSELPAGPHLSQSLVPELSGTRDPAELSSRHEHHLSSDMSMLDSKEVPAELSSRQERQLSSDTSVLDSIGVSTELLSRHQRQLSSDSSILDSTGVTTELLSNRERPLSDVSELDVAEISELSNR